MATMTTVSRVIAARAMRGFVDGFVSVLLARYLDALGFSPFQIGAIVAGTLVGSAAITLAVGLQAHRFAVRTLLLTAAALMAGTGAGFAIATTFWLVLAVAVVGTLNPTGGDVSVFLPTEQALLAAHVEPHRHTAIYARHNLSGAFAAALGALASALPEPIAHALDVDAIDVQRASFLLYAAVALAVAAMYRGLPNERPSSDLTKRRRGALDQSRRTVLELAALFSLDSAGSGFVVQSLLVLWLHLRFDLAPATTGVVFFAAALLGGLSQLFAGPLAARIGLIRTMVFTHVPANALLATAAFAPNATVAVALLLGRALMSQMDVPARQAFVMAVVRPEERPAAASVTNVPRSLASAATPLAAGVLLGHSTTVGWPLLVAGVSKIVYDLLLLALFRDVAAEEGATRQRRPAAR